MQSFTLALEGLGGLTAAETARAAAEAMEATFSQLQYSVMPYDLRALTEGTTITLPTVTSTGALTEASYTLIEVPAEDNPENSTATNNSNTNSVSGNGNGNGNGNTDSADASSAAPTTLQAIIDCAPLCKEAAGDTYGVGVLVADAITRGATTIVLLADKVATCDAGTGLLVALGAQFHDENHTNVAPGDLAAMRSMDAAQFNMAALGVEFLLVVGENYTAPAKQCCWPACSVLDVEPTTPGFGAAGGIAIALAWLRPQQETTVLAHAFYIAALSGQLAEPGIVIAGAPRITKEELNNPCSTAGAFTTSGRPVAFIGDEVELPEAIPHIEVEGTGTRAVQQAVLTLVNNLL